MDTSNYPTVRFHGSENCTHNINNHINITKSYVNVAPNNVVEQT